jgi:hypothetical protein
MKLFFVLIAFILDGLIKCNCSDPPSSRQPPVNLPGLVTILIGEP